MRVVGPAWPSTQALVAALAEVGEPGTVLRWGTEAMSAVQQLTALHNASAGKGWSSPEFTTDLTAAQIWVREGATVLGRKLHHTQGRDIVLPASPRWRRRELWVKFVPSASEYRQHIWKGRAIRVGKKVYNVPNETTPSLPIRSRLRGWTIDYGQSPTPDALRDLVRTAAKQSVEAVGYPGGAVDLLVTEGGGVVVLEVNKAPSLRDQATLDAYVRAITKHGV